MAKQIFSISKPYMDSLLKISIDEARKSLTESIEKKDFSIDAIVESLDMPLLHCCARKNRWDLVNLVLELGGDINSLRVVNGFTAMHIAATHGYYKIVAGLLQKGGDGELKNAHTDTPIDILLDCGEETTIDFIESLYNKRYASLRQFLAEVSENPDIDTHKLSPKIKNLILDECKKNIKHKLKIPPKDWIEEELSNFLDDIVIKNAGRALRFLDRMVRADQHILRIFTESEYDIWDFLLVDDRMDEVTIFMINKIFSKSFRTLEEVLNDADYTRGYQIIAGKIIKNRPDIKIPIKQEQAVFEVTQKSTSHDVRVEAVGNFTTHDLRALMLLEPSQGNLKLLLYNLERCDPTIVHSLTPSEKSVLADILLSVKLTFKGQIIFESLYESDAQTTAPVFTRQEEQAKATETLISILNGNIDEKTIGNIQLALEKGADINAVDELNQTVFHILASKTNTYDLKRLGFLEDILKLLLQQPHIDFGKKDITGRVALQIFADFYVLEIGEELNNAHFKLFLGKMMGDRKNVQYINLFDISGRTHLSDAAKFGRNFLGKKTEFLKVEALLEAGADPDLFFFSGNGQTYSASDFNNAVLCSERLKEILSRYKPRNAVALRARCRPEHLRTVIDRVFRGGGQYSVWLESMLDDCDPEIMDELLLPAPIKEMLIILAIEKQERGFGNPSKNIKLLEKIMQIRVEGQAPDHAYTVRTMRALNPERASAADGLLGAMHKSDYSSVSSALKNHGPDIMGLLIFDKPEDKNILLEFIISQEFIKKEGFLQKFGIDNSGYICATEPKSLSEVLTQEYRCSKSDAKILEDVSALAPSDAANGTQKSMALHQFFSVFLNPNPATLEIQKAILKLLLENGFDPKASGELGNTAFHYAALSNNLPLIEYFLDEIQKRPENAGCLDLVNDMGETVLLSAINSNSGNDVIFKKIEILVRAGATPREEYFGVAIKQKLTSVAEYFMEYVGKREVFSGNVIEETTNAPRSGVFKILEEARKKVDSGSSIRNAVKEMLLPKIKELKESIEYQFIYLESKGLTESAENEAKSLGISVEAYKEIILQILGEEKEVAQETNIIESLRKYVNHRCSVDDLFRNQIIGGLVDRYNGSKELSISSLMLVNNGTTFAIRLCKAARKEVIIDFFQSLAKHAKENSKLVQNYLRLFETGTNNTVCEILEQRGLLAEIMRLCPNLLSPSGGKKPSEDTHLSSITESVAESLSKLYEKYRINREEVENNLQKLNGFLEFFENERISGRSQEMEKFLSKTHGWDKLDRTRQEKLIKDTQSEVGAAMRLVKLITIGKVFASTYTLKYTIDPEERLYCPNQEYSINLRDVVAISFCAAEDLCGWFNSYLTREDHLCALIKSLYDARRGYNLENPGGDQENDGNRCPRGTLNAIISIGMVGHKCVNIIIINEDTVRNELNKKLPEIVKYLSGNEECRTLISHWLSGGTIDPSLTLKIILKIKDEVRELKIKGEVREKDLFEICWEFQINDFVTKVLANFDVTKLCEVLGEKYPDVFEARYDLNGFIIDRSDDEVRYVPTLEFLFRLNKPKFREVLAVKLCSGGSAYNELKVGMLLFELLLNSLNEEFAQSVNGIMIEVFKSFDAEQKNTLLEDFVKHDLYRLFCSLLDAGVDLLAPHNDDTIFHIVARSGSRKMMERLFEGRSDDERFTLLLLEGKGVEKVSECAISSGNVPLIKLLLPYSDLSEISFRGGNGCHIAAKYDFLDIIKKHFNKYGWGGLSELMLKKINLDGLSAVEVAFQYRSIGVIEFALSHFLSLPYNDKMDLWFHLAAEYNLVEVMKKRISSLSLGQFNARDECCCTPLDYAVLSNETEVLNLLLDKMKGNISPDVLSSAVLNAAKIKNPEAMRILLELYPKLKDTKNGETKSLTKIAINHDCYRVVEVLLEKEVIVDGDDVFCAVAKVGLKDLNVLIEKGNIDTSGIRDSGCNTLLHRACLYGKVHIAEMLIKKHPELLNVTNSNGQTPLDIVRVHENKTLIEIVTKSLRPSAEVLDGSVTATQKGIEPDIVDSM